MSDADPSNRSPQDADAFFAQVAAEAIDETEFEIAATRMTNFLAEHGVIISDGDVGSNEYFLRLKELFASASASQRKLDESLTLALIDPDEFKSQLASLLEAFDRDRISLMQTTTQDEKAHKVLHMLVNTKVKHHDRDHGSRRLNRHRKRQAKHYAQAYVIAHGLEDAWVSLVDTEFKGKLLQGEQLDDLVHGIQEEIADTENKELETQVEVMMAMHLKGLDMSKLVLGLERERMFVEFLAQALKVSRDYPDRKADCREKILLGIIASADIEDKQPWVEMIDELFNFETEN